MYAVFRTGGKQFRAEPGARIRIPALQAEPGDTNARLKLGDVHLKSGDKTAAIETYKQVAAQFSKSGFDAKAVAIYKQILRIDESYLEARIRGDRPLDYARQARAWGWTSGGNPATKSSRPKWTALKMRNMAVWLAAGTRIVALPSPSPSSAPSVLTKIPELAWLTITLR